MDLQGSFEYLGLNGFLLSPGEQAALSCSLLRLSQQAGRPVRFWGKVLGYNNDYMVAQGTPVTGHAPVPVDQLGLRQSWYSVDGGHSWTTLESGGPIYKLPKGEVMPASLDTEEVRREHREVYCEQIRGRFWGNPDFEYKVKEEMPEPDPDVAPPPPPKATEEEEEKEEDEPAGDEEEKEEGEEEKEED
eukprot:Hpha_TRINITY_DN145_c0_g1::TRINITY_DN145_c0_g1_i1::g.82257::m.82257/K19757/RSPH9; radial spoke head protein 9